MAKPLPTSGSHRNGFKGDPPWSAHTDFGNSSTRPVAEAPADVGLLEPEEALHRQLAALAGDAAEGAVPDSTPDLNVGQKVVVEQLRKENSRLRAQVGELEQAIEEVSGQASPAIRDQLRECESLLEQKSEIIRELHRKLEEDPEPAPRPAGASPREEELLALSEELERERRQLKEDEESLMQQMRDMEVQMSRERAEIARQRNELQRLQNDIRHELEMAARDATLRERLAPLQRRQQEMQGRRGAAPSDTGTTAPASVQPAATEAPARKDSSILRRLFG